MPSKVLYVTKDAIVRSPNRGSGRDPHNTVGEFAGEEERTLLDFDPHGVPTGTKLTGAKVTIKRSTGAPPTGHDTPDVGSQVIPGRITQDWGEGKAGTDHLYGTGNAVTWSNKPNVTDELSARGSQPATGKWSFDVTPIAQSWVDGAAQRGIQLRKAVAGAEHDIVFDSLQSADGKNAITLELTWGANATNRAPDKPVIDAPVPGSDGKSFTATAKYTDPDGDNSGKSEWIFTPDPQT